MRRRNRGRSSHTSAHGLTLEQLHQIGQDVGIAAEHITRAAGAVERGDLVPTQQSAPGSDCPWACRARSSSSAPCPTTNGRHSWRRSAKHSTRAAASPPKVPSGSGITATCRRCSNPRPTGIACGSTTRKGDARVRVAMGAEYLALAALFAALMGLGAVSDKAGVGVLLLDAWAWGRWPQRTSACPAGRACAHRRWRRSRRTRRRWPRCSAEFGPPHRLLAMECCGWHHFGLV